MFVRLLTIYQLSQACFINHSEPLRTMGGSSSASNMPAVFPSQVAGTSLNLLFGDEGIVPRAGGVACGANVVGLGHQ